MSCLDDRKAVKRLHPERFSNKDQVPPADFVFANLIGLQKAGYLFRELGEGFDDAGEQSGLGDGVIAV